MRMRSSSADDVSPVAKFGDCRTADVVAHASKIEETSNVILEALACGRPLLVAAESGAGRHVVEGETGLVVEDNEPATWARALKRVTTDEALRARLARGAAAWAEGGIPSWQDVLREDLVSVWERARSNATAARPA